MAAITSLNLATFCGGQPQVINDRDRFPGETQGEGLDLLGVRQFIEAGEVVVHLPLGFPSCEVRAAVNLQVKLGQVTSTKNERHLRY